MVHWLVARLATSDHTDRVYLAEREGECRSYAFIITNKGYVPAKFDRCGEACDPPMMHTYMRLQASIRRARPSQQWLKDIRYSPVPLRRI